MYGGRGTVKGENGEGKSVGRRKGKEERELIISSAGISFNSHCK